MRTVAKGFTLIELLVTIVIFAILWAVAIPSYQGFMDSSRRADGVAAVSGLQIAQEKFRANCPFYAQNLGAADVCGANAAGSTVAYDNTSEEGFYALSIQANSATGNAFTILADPQNDQAGDTDCDPLTITVNGANPNGLRTPAGCWF